MAGTKKGVARSNREQGKQASDFYLRIQRSGKVVKPHEIPWEGCGPSKKKDLIKAVKPTFQNLDACIHVLSPGACSDPHRHMTEELVYILEGRGYDLHWENGSPTKSAGPAQQKPDPTRYEWQQGDTVYIPINVLHQHVNLDMERPVRFLSAISRIPDYTAIDRPDRSSQLTAD